MSDDELLIIVMTAFSGLAFTILLIGTIYEGCCNKRYGDGYIAGTFFFLALCFLSRGLDIFFLFHEERETDDFFECKCITSNVLPYTFFVLAALINVSRWIKVTTICSAMSDRNSTRIPPYTSSIIWVVRLFVFLTVVVSVLLVLFSCHSGIATSDTALDDVLVWEVMLAHLIVVVLYLGVLFMLGLVLNRYFKMEYNQVRCPFWMLMIANVVCVLARDVSFILIYFVHESRLLTPIETLSATEIVFIYVTEVVPALFIAWTVVLARQAKSRHRTASSLMSMFDDYGLLNN